MFVEPVLKINYDTGHCAQVYTESCKINMLNERLGKYERFKTGFLAMPKIAEIKRGVLSFYNIINFQLE
jgi:hypothetical protein